MQCRGRTAGVVYEFEICSAEMTEKRHPGVGRQTSPYPDYVRVARHPGTHLAMRRGRKIAKVAMARRLAVRLYCMWRKGWNYEQLTKYGSHAGQPGNPHGVQ